MFRADRRRALAAAAAAAVAVAWPRAAPAQPAPAALTLPQLMQRLATRKSGEARFTEERTVAGIDGPLTASGVLSFVAPDRFVRQTLSPTRESLELQGRTLMLRRGNRARTLEMDSVPEIAALLDAMRATLTGDAVLLQRHFRAALSGNDAKWVLHLTPADPKLAQQLQRIEIVGQASDLRSIELRLASGDRSLMLLEPLAPLSTPAPALPASR